jgi:hypothetical protein
MAKVQQKSGNRRDKRAAKSVDRNKDAQKERAVRGLLAGAQKLQAQRQFMLKLLALMVHRAGGEASLEMADLAASRDLAIEFEGSAVKLRSVESQAPDKSVEQTSAEVVGGMESMRELNDEQSQASLT